MENYPSFTYFCQIFYTTAFKYVKIKLLINYLSGDKNKYKASSKSS